LKLDLEAIAREKGLGFRVRPTNANVATDPLMLRRILQNLSANAVHYTERGEILLAARRRGDSIRIEVWDTGPGIAAADCSRIFEEFQRGASAAGRHGNGFGLGLSIARRMAETLGHPLGLRSRVDKGTCFTVSAPFAGEAAHAPIRPPPSPAAATHQPYGFDGTRVVVIDNEPAILDAMRALLERWSCAVETATNFGRLQGAPSSSLGPFQPDLVLADYHLDNGDCGLNAVQKLRALWGERLPAIIITADHSQPIADAVRDAGCELLRKPLKPAELRVLMLTMLRDDAARG
jgi:CheY-like chemotaxis protein